LRPSKKDIGAVPESAVNIYIYANSSDLQGAHLFAAEWEGGVTFAEYNVIGIGVSPITYPTEYGQYYMK